MRELFCSRVRTVFSSGANGPKLPRLNSKPVGMPDRVATRSGIPTGLEFRRGSFGPFAPELKTVLTRLQNNSLIREERLGRMFAVKTGPTFNDARSVYHDSLARWNDTINRLVDLFL